MADATTTYDIKVRYGLQGGNQFRGQLGGVAKEADKTAKSLASIKRMMAAPFVMRGLGIAKSFLLDFNNQVEGARISLAAMISMNLHVPFERAEGAANAMFDTFQRMAKSSPGTTKDFIDMAQAITGSVLAFGGNLRQVEALTQGGVIGAQAFGIRADMMGLDIQQALAGSLGKKDRISNLLRAQTGLDATQFNAKSAGERFKLLMATLQSPAIKAAADRYANSYAGQLSSFQDNLQIIGGKVGLPVFKAITAELKKWNTWIDANPKKVERFAKQAGSAIAAGFTVMKDALAFMIEHRETLMYIAGAFGAGVVTKRLAGIATAAGRGQRDEFGRFLPGTTSNLQKFSAALQLAAIGAGGFYIAWQSLKNGMKDQRPPGEKRQDELIAEYLRKHGNAGAADYRNLLGSDMPGMGAETLKATRYANTVLRQEQKVAEAKAAAEKKLAEGKDKKTQELLDKAAGKPSTTNVNVTIQRVVSEHPDRFAQNLDGAIEDTRANPTQADTAWKRRFG